MRGKAELWTPRRAAQAVPSARRRGDGEQGGKAVRADDKHPEKRMKAAFKGYEDRELPKLRAEFPTLRRSQLNELLFRNWSRSSENPLNAAKLGGDSDR